ncbi:hypothetical protein C8T65DRAFT_543347, partial [Cerioporus squamosus]
LDVSARNEAIDLTYLKQYVSSGAARPRWTIVADAIFARKTAASAKAVEDSAKVNTLIQSWKASTHPVVGLSRDLKCMLQTANRYNAALAPVNPAEGFKGSMPVWYHIGETEGRSLANSLSARCLREQHGVVTV